MKIVPIRETGASRTGTLNTDYNTIVKQIGEPNVTDLDNDSKTELMAASTVSIKSSSSFFSPTHASGTAKFNKAKLCSGVFALFGAPGEMDSGLRPALRAPKSAILPICRTPSFKTYNWRARRDSNSRPPGS